MDVKHCDEILVDGRISGLTAHRDCDDQGVVRHTGFDDASAGQGLASILVQQALSDVRTAGKRIVPFADITDPVAPEILRWLDTVVPP